MNGIFITGTDTGIGKTFIAASVLTTLHNQGRKVIAMKPIQTGANNSSLSPDINFILSSAKIKVQKEEYKLLAPYIFKMPASPHLAAQKERRIIDINKILSCLKELEKRYRTVIVEGAGGLMVPIFKKYFIIDLIKDMKLPVILVALSFI